MRVWYSTNTYKHLLFNNIKIISDDTEINEIKQKVYQAVIFSEFYACMHKKNIFALKTEFQL